MKKRILVLILLLFCLGTGAGYVILEKKIIMGELLIANGEKQVAEGQKEVDAGKVKLAQGKRKLSVAKQAVGVVNNMPFPFGTVAKVMPVSAVALHAANSEIAEGDAKVANGQTRLKSGESQLSAGKLALNQGKQKLQEAEKIKKGLGFSSLFFGILTLGFGCYWRRTVFNFSRPKKS